MNKRRQRSTQIRKRIEKKQREEQKARRRAAKGGGADVERILLGAALERATAEGCAGALASLEARLRAEPVRGWTLQDLGGEHGLSWLRELLESAVADTPPEATEVDVELDEEARRAVLDRLEALERASAGLGVAWDEVGFGGLIHALAQATEVEEEDEGTEGDSGPVAQSG